MAVTQLYKSYGLDANTFVEVQVDPPESPNGDVKNGSDSTDVQTFVPTDRVQNLTEDVLPLDITHHNSPVQTKTPARKHPKSSQTSKKSATPATPFALRRPKRSRKPRYIYSPSKY